MAEAQETIYIDEQKGKDDASAIGAENAPYSTLQYAYIQTDGQAKYVVAKYEEDKPVEWAPASKAGTKKAATALATHKKKQAKELELIERTKKEAEAREKALEEAKKIVITEDASLPKARKIKLDEIHDILLHNEDIQEKGTRVRVLGRQ
jgi:asparaginyl-tRNA synthetase